MIAPITPIKTIARMTTPELYTHTWETVQASLPTFEGPWTLLPDPRGATGQKMSRGPQIAPTSDSG